jgi:hypothetical protein
MQDRACSLLLHPTVGAIMYRLRRPVSLGTATGAHENSFNFAQIAETPVAMKTTTTIAKTS